MPVTARFSSRFYERLGDEVAQELVNWFNSVDQDYRTQLQRQNDENWARFSDRLDARTAELNSGTTGLRAELNNAITSLRAELIKWMFGFWVAFWLATVLPLGGLILRQ
ncbi:hypothetical protein BH23GEM2_BH23GEM2_20470 [soil metagenome]